MMMCIVHFSVLTIVIMLQSCHALSGRDASAVRSKTGVPNSLAFEAKTTAPSGIELKVLDKMSTFFASV